MGVKVDGVSDVEEGRVGVGGGCGCGGEEGIGGMGRVELVQVGSGELGNEMVASCGEERDGEVDMAWVGV